jgi:hypothetical protein
MNKKELDALPKTRRIPTAENVAQRFYAPGKRDPHLASGLLEHSKRGSCSTLGGLATMKQPKGRK